MNWRYQLSNLLPVPMQSTYRTQGHREHARWVQWRHRIWMHRRYPADA